MVLEAERIYLRPLQEFDVEDFSSWFSDGHVTRFLGMKALTRDKAKTRFNELLNDPNGIYFGIIKKDEKRIMGYVFLAHILKSHRVAREFGIVIGNRNLWGQGYGKEAAKLMLEHGFRHLKLHRIQLIALDFNERALHLYQKLGFVEEGIQREARIVDGKWHNVVMMSMLEQEFDQ